MPSTRSSGRNAASAQSMDTTTAAGKLFALLDAFGPEQPDFSLAELSVRSGLPKSTSHRILAVLETLAGRRAQRVGPLPARDQVLRARRPRAGPAPAPGGGPAVHGGPPGHHPGDGPPGQARRHRRPLHRAAGEPPQRPVAVPGGGAGAGHLHRGGQGDPGLQPARRREGGHRRRAAGAHRLQHHQPGAVPRDAGADPHHRGVVRQRGGLARAELRGRADLQPHRAAAWRPCRCRARSGGSAPRR